ncbi:DUF4910 domain-containing protein [Pararhizobium haloflavum]|uniref:DUF4910 domain-containing protein n=1 Tax=Pararhizobium haloflavum TaxID=2037914 RepID=UPI000C17B329|nr:DUF4910 domain-containing protein [Pararhizobium haloflavum]
MTMHASAPPARPADGVCGAELHDLAARLYPICRSITGDGVRQTLAVLSEHLPIAVREVPTGTQLFDWTVPQEWRVRSARLRDPGGQIVVDFADNNLHLMSYSAPFRGRMSRQALSAHIHTLPDQPDLIPYRTSYYNRDWGLCMAHSRFSALPEGEYDVEIDTDFVDGSLTYGEYVHPGTSDREFLLSAHICHPSLANDNCSGLAVLTMMAAMLKGRRTRYGYRFLFAPGTLGALAWLAANEERAQRIDHGLIVSCVGDAGRPTYKRSRQGSAEIDRIMAHLVKRRGGSILDFSPYGYDERQYCSPGFNLPVGLIQRSAFGTFPEYHTSADNLAFIRPECLAQSLDLLCEAIEIAETNWTPLSLNPKGEPQLGRRGLYAAIGGRHSTGASAMGLLWVMNLADGRHSLLDMAERADMPYADIAAAAALLRDHGLLSDASAGHQVAE